MNSNYFDKDDVFKFMRRNYQLANDEQPENFKSAHWNTFNKNYDRLFDLRSAWDRMLRNALTLGFNDSLLGITNQRFLRNKENLWSDLQSGDMKDLVSENTDKREFEKEKRLFRQIIAATDLNFVVKNCITNVGNPIVTRFKLTHNGETLTAYFNRHDVGDLYHAWLILSHLEHLKDSSPIICEIGGGFGGLIAKIKSNVKGAKIILLDLPEVNACQSYYLSQVFSNAIIYGYGDFLEKGISILDTDFDFLVLPGWAVQQLPRGLVDVFVNIRSMMEMSKENLDFYFDSIQTSLKLGGIFSCFNRYQKRVGSFENKFMFYPFDNDWETLMSQPSLFQPHIHQLTLKRMKKNSGSNFKERLGEIQQK